MKIALEQVETVARLARLDLSRDELVRLAGEMDAILAYVDKLNELDTEGIVPTSHAVPMENADRPDVAQPSLGAEGALANAPDRIADFFRVPKVIE